MCFIINDEEGYCYVARLAFLYGRSSDIRSGLVFSELQFLGTMKSIFALAHNLETEYGFSFVVARTRNVVENVQDSNLLNRASAASRFRHICTANFPFR